MAGAYAALCSLMSVIDNLQNHPNPPISLHKLQVDALVDKIAFFQEFLEVYSHSEAIEGPASLIRDAASAAEDAIESYLMDQIRRSTSSVESYLMDRICGSTSYVDKGDRVYQDLQKIMDDMDLIKKTMTELKEKIVDDEDHRHIISSTSNASLVSPSLGQKSIMVGFDDMLHKILYRLISSQSRSREIIPIVGMGGIGKTTLALNAYEKDFTKEHFDIRCWVTISQKYSIRHILLEICNLGQNPDEICNLGQNPDEICNLGQNPDLSQLSKEQLGDMLYKNLFGQRYLIVMDDMWDTNIWNEIKRFFPDCNNDSKIIITTRMENVAIELTDSFCVHLDLLNENQSWNLLCETVFGEDTCPLELEESGIIIANNCKGLPLSIVVIGGLLKKSKQTKEYWEYIGRNISSIINLEEDERCFKILYISYRQLPVHLKLCFLYIGLYPEDKSIRITWFIKLLVAEGFLKPIGNNTMEDVGKEFIRELANRNLLLINVKAVNRDIKYFKIHDVLRNLCMREAQKEKLLYTEHRNATYRRTMDELHGHFRKPWRTFEFLENSFAFICRSLGVLLLKRHVLPSCESVLCIGSLVTFWLVLVSFFTKKVKTLLARSIHMVLFWLFGLSWCIYSFTNLLGGQSWCFNSRRILIASDDPLPFLVEDKINVRSERGIFHLYNLSYLEVANVDDLGHGFGSSLSMFWNLQTLLIQKYKSPHDAIFPVDIWKLPQVRHVRVPNIHLPSPPSNGIILWKLQTLSRVKELTWCEEVVKRIPNVRKLEICYDYHEDYSHYHLDNIQHLDKLENFKCVFAGGESEACMSNLQQHLVFPRSLKKLVVSAGNQLHWEHVTTMIGSLPNLEKLLLQGITGSEWKTSEVEFLRLKYLYISRCSDWKYWIVESTHFPLLRWLFTVHIFNLEEIPSDIGEISTLENINVIDCSDSVVISVKKIAEEQGELENSEFRGGVILTTRNTYEAESLASHNFVVVTPEEYMKRQLKNK